MRITNFNFSIGPGGVFRYEVPGRISEYPPTIEDPARRARTIGLDSVLAVQSLGMKILKEKDRSVRQIPGKHLFAARNTSGDDVAPYDGSNEELMSFLVTKAGFDQRRMFVQFRTNVMSIATRATSCVDLYRFDWTTRSESSQAWFGRIHKTNMGEYTMDKWSDVCSLDEEDVAELLKRMSDHHEENILQRRWAAVLAHETWHGDLRS